MLPVPSTSGSISNVPATKALKRNSTSMVPPGGSAGSVHETRAPRLQAPLDAFAEMYENGLSSAVTSLRGSEVTLPLFATTP